MKIAVEIYREVVEKQFNVFVPIGYKIGNTLIEDKQKVVDLGFTIKERLSLSDEYLMDGDNRFQFYNIYKTDGIFQPDLVKIIAVKIEKIKTEIQAHIDNQAVLRGFDNINTISKFVGYPNHFRDVSEALGLWCSECWVVVGKLEKEYLDGNIDEPSIEYILSQLPTLK